MKDYLSNMELIKIKNGQLVVSTGFFINIKAVIKNFSMSEALRRKIQILCADNSPEAEDELRILAQDIGIDQIKV